MSRTLIASIACCVLLSAAGCTMCASTFDECGPVANGACPYECGSNGRAGSILSGGVSGAMVPDELADQVLSPTEMKTEPAVQPRRTTTEPRGVPTEGWKASKPAETPQRGP